MSVLDILHQIKPEQLNSRCYFQSLLEQAHSCGLLSDAELSKIQMELLIILAEQTDKWNQGKSSSIPTEKAQELLTSAIFVIGIQLKSYQTPENAVEVLKTEPLKSLFEKGLNLVQRKIAISRHRQKRIAAHLLNTPNVYYRSTIIDGINGFFKLYRPQFTAQEIHITADYPAYLGRPNFDGIEFIERYLRCIEAENEFCMHFAPQDIHHLLCGLTQDYHSVPMNLYFYPRLDLPSYTATQKDLICHKMILFLSISLFLKNQIKKYNLFLKMRFAIWIERWNCRKFQNAISICAYRNLLKLSKNQLS